MSRSYKINDPDAIYFVTCTVIEWIDLFTRDSYREVIIDSLKYCQKHKGLAIHAYCIMSNHIHLIISRKKKPTLSDILRDFKKYTCLELMKLIDSKKESRRNWLLWVFGSNGRRNPNNTHFQIWVQDNHPIELTAPGFLQQRLNYLHNNPVKAGIVYSPEDYVFSSASAYCGRLEEAVIEIDFLNL